MTPGLSMGEEVAQSMEDLFNPLVRDLFHLNKPTVAAVNGTAAGGGVGLALAADIALAARSATLQARLRPEAGDRPGLRSQLPPAARDRARPRAGHEHAGRDRSRPSGRPSGD